MYATRQSNHLARKVVMPRTTITPPRQPIAPAVYRPEAKKIVQPKVVAQQRTPPTAPPVYRPEQKRIAQPKIAATAPARTMPKAPPVGCPQPTPVNAQPKITVASPRHVSGRPPAQMKSKVVAPPRFHPQPARPASTLQMKVSHDGTKFVGDGDRAAWRKQLKEWVIADYNQRKGANLSLSTDLSDAELDRCHKISFSDIENAVVKYLNGQMNQAKFVELTDSITSDPKQLNEIRKFRSFLYASPNETQANRLLSICNSALGNVMLANASMNRSIQEHLDLHFTQNASGAWGLTPNSFSRADAWQGHTSGFALTPQGTNIKSSSSGLIPIANLTPKTDTVAKGHGL